MSRIVRVLSLLFLIQGLSLLPASAQTGAPSPSRASVGVNGGLAAASQGNGAAMGAQVAFDVTDRFVLEVDGSYLGRRAGSHGMSATASILVNLVPPDRKTVPYLAVGGGVYRASFGLGHDQFFGRLSGEYPAGTQMVPISGMHGFGMMQGPYSGPSMWTGPWTGATYTPNHMPGFYVDRLGQMRVPANGRWGMRSFADPALSVGGGIKLDLSSRLYVRPDARALIVIANRDTYTVGVMSIGLGFKF